MSYNLQCCIPSPQRLHMADSDTRPFAFGTKELDALTAAAQASPRRRKNLNFHRSDAARAHRLLNAVEPDSYVQPHRHMEADKDETLIAVRGAFGVVFFDEDGRIADTAVIGAQSERIGVNIPRAVFHTLVSLASGSAFMEAKAGPYDPQADKELPAWAPRESDPQAAAYHARLRALFPR